MCGAKGAEWRYDIKMETLIMRTTRRSFLANATGAACGYFLLTATASARAVIPTTATRIILLGTKGGPSLGKFRTNAATLLLINDVPYLIDCGYGVSRQLIAAGISLDRLRYIFLTHYHSDHNLEYGPLLYN